MDGCARNANLGYIYRRLRLPYATPWLEMGRICMGVRADMGAL